MESTGWIVYSYGLMHRFFLCQKLFPILCKTLLYMPYRWCWKIRGIPKMFYHRICGREDDKKYNFQSKDVLSVWRYENGELSKQRLSYLKLNICFLSAGMFPSLFFWLIRRFRSGSKFSEAALYCNEDEKQLALFPLKFHRCIYTSYRTKPVP